MSGNPRTGLLHARPKPAPSAVFDQTSYHEPMVSPSFVGKLTTLTTDGNDWTSQGPSPVKHPAFARICEDTELLGPQPITGGPLKRKLPIAGRFRWSKSCHCGRLQQGKCRKHCVTPGFSHGVRRFKHLVPKPTLKHTSQFCKREERDDPSTCVTKRSWFQRFLGAFGMMPDCLTVYTNLGASLQTNA